MSPDLGFLAHPDRLTFCSIETDARPMTWIDAEGRRCGFEPDVAAAIGATLGLDVAWVNRRWAEFVSTLEAGTCDGVLCSQAITPYRLEVVGFTLPYGAFDEAVLVRAGSGIRSAAELRGLRVGAIEPSTNMDLARTFVDVRLVGFGGRTDDILGDMLAALAGGDIDALVDDELVVGEIAAAHDAFEVAFVAPTQNRYAIAVRKQAEDVRQLFNRVLEALHAGGELEEIWDRWFPDRPFPLEAAARPPRRERGEDDPGDRVLG
jgi:polar amino acid transport system substrate-binding protein